MTKIEYLSMSKPQRAFHGFIDFFANLPRKTGRLVSRLPRKTGQLVQKVVKPFYNIYDAVLHGDWRTRLSVLLMGFGQFTRGQQIRGVLYFVYEAFFVTFMALFGFKYLSGLGTLGQLAEVTIKVDGIRTSYYYDNSFEILIYSIVTIAFIVIAAYLWYSQLVDSIKLQRYGYVGKKFSNKQTLSSIVNQNYDKTLMAMPMFGLTLFTIIPTVIMILIGFTNYSSAHLTPKSLVDWVGLQNFEKVFGGVGSDGSLFLYAFGMVLLWTLIWAFFATFSNYFLGMFVAMIINSKGIKLKKLWRTVLVTTIAVPQFISLLLMNRMLNTDVGIFNEWLEELGWISTGIPWLNSPILSKVVIILVNTWIGIPYTMLICTGLLMNIPTDLYESAKIDGAGPFKTYTKITLPYMLFVTTPYLISQFVGNINNFNVIYLLSGGNPLFTNLGSNAILASLGQTDLLITWIYKISLTNVSKDYGFASVLGLLIFVVVAFFSLIFFNRSSSMKDEEEFQ